MRRRLDLASALIGRPRLLFLDEPTTGLDPRSRLGMWDVIRGLVREGTTLLLTTQYLEEADELADTIAVVDHGKIIARGTADELKAPGRRRADRGRRAATAPTSRGRSRSSIATATARRRVDEHTRRLTVPAHGGAMRLVQVVRDLDEASIGIDDIGIRRPTLDDVFLSLTGHAAEETDGGRGMTATHERGRPRPPAAPAGGIAWRPRRRLGHHVAQPQAHPADPGARDLRDLPVDHVRAAVRVRVRRRDPVPGYSDPSAYREYLMPGIFVQTIVFAAATARSACATTSTRASSIASARSRWPGRRC